MLGFIIKHDTIKATQEDFFYDIFWHNFKHPYSRNLVHSLLEAITSEHVRAAQLTLLTTLHDLLWMSRKNY